jgi:hypothetical protein
MFSAYLDRETQWGGQSRCAFAQDNTPPQRVSRLEVERDCVLFGTARRNDSVGEFPRCASCLPESSRRALVADAREIRQYQMHPTPRKRDEHPKSEFAALPHL